MTVSLVTGTAALGWLIAPLLIVSVVAWVTAALVHLALTILVPHRKPFEVTLRLTMYSFGANAVYIVPIIGDSAAWIWSIVISIIAIREWHRTTGWRATIAKLWPIVILFGIGVIFVTLLLTRMA